MQPHEIRAALMLEQKKIKDLAAELGVTPSAIQEVITSRTKSPRIRAHIAKTIKKEISDIWP